MYTYCQITSIPTYEYVGLLVVAKIQQKGDGAMLGLTLLTFAR